MIEIVGALPAGHTGRPRLITEQDQEELRARPGEWALVVSGPEKSHRVKPKYLGEEYEWTYRAADGVRSYYVRYNPNGETPAASETPAE